MASATAFDFSTLLNQPSADNKRASEEIFDQIKEVILSGELTPGDRLPSERNLMTALERSRPTIREALRMLEREGFIKTIPGSHGAIVQELGTGNIRESVENALQLKYISAVELGEYHDMQEFQTAIWAAQRRTDEDLDAMRNCLIQAATELSDYKRFLPCGSKFHAAIAAAAKNEVTLTLTKVLSDITNTYVEKYVSQQPPEEQSRICRQIYDKHMQLFSAISAKDKTAVKAIMQNSIIPFTEDMEPDRG